MCCQMHSRFWLCFTGRWFRNFMSTAECQETQWERQTRGGKSWWKIRTSTPNKQLWWVFISILCFGHIFASMIKISPCFMKKHGILCKILHPDFTVQNSFLKSVYLSCISIFSSDPHLRPSHTTTETTKKSLSSIQTTTFFHNCNDFSTVWYMGNDFHNNFFGKIFVKIFVVCKGLIWVYY